MTLDQQIESLCSGLPPVEVATAFTRSLLLMSDRAMDRTHQKALRKLAFAIGRTRRAIERAGAEVGQ